MLLDALADHLEGLAAERDGVLGVLPGLVADDSPGWIPAAALVREPYEGLLALVDETAARWSAPRHVAAALLWKTYGYWHTMPMALGWGLGRRVPLMRLEDTLVRTSAAGVTVAASRVTVAVLPSDPLAGTEGTVVVSDLAAAIREALLESQYPFVSALGTLTRVGERTLWGSTAEAFAHPLLTLGPYAEAARLLDEIGPPVAGLLTPDGDGYRRRTCCLWVTLPDAEACSTCCVC
ncbi:(2Fe-2S)-binding protein [Microbispora hainanensis]|uniref:(2Fe-2S)-binding protein n=1 Tax=Microbispora hainanensis TaxID=568844 RepID=A0A544YVF2_9ACTN|nr:(2Fe-2S)-binding protein [Microbispora hainanensis]TQS20750.1 (2Fe-2S)-binding protein [Microbispora hainanensis]